MKGKKEKKKLKAERQESLKQSSPREELCDGNNKQTTQIGAGTAAKCPPDLWVPIMAKVRVSNDGAKRNPRDCDRAS